MPSISIPTAILAGGALTAGAGLLSANAQAGAAQSAASTQAAAAQNAAQLQLNEFNQTQGNLQPYVAQGAGAAGALSPLIGTQPGGNPLTSFLTKPFQPTMDQLAQTPGYQFTLGQGLQAAQNGFAAQGLGSSGAAVKGGVQYAEGLAGTTYQQQFSNDLANKLQIYNMLAGQSQLGENAAAMVGSQGLQATQGAGGLLTSGAAAQAAGTIGAANALSGGLGALAGAGGNAATLLALNNQGLFGNQGGGQAAGGPTAQSYTYGGSAGFVPAGSWSPEGYAY